MGQAFLYGNGGSGSGGTLTVTAPAGVTVTIFKDGKVKTKTADSSGVAIFKGLSSGTWTVTITDGSQTSPAYTVTIVADYAVTVSFFSATIAVTYPEGSICTCSDGSTTLTAPTTSGSYTFTVPNAGDWTVSCTDGENNDSAIVTITTDGESQSVLLAYMLYYKGNEYTNKTGGWNVDNGSKESDYINVYVYSKSTGEYTGTASHADPVDLTSKTTVSVHVTEANSSTSQGKIDITIKDIYGGVAARTNVITYDNSCNDKTFNIDVSSLKGSYFVNVVATTGYVVAGRHVYVRFDEVSYL